MQDVSENWKDSKKLNKLDLTLIKIISNNQEKKKTMKKT